MAGYDHPFCLECPYHERGHLMGTEYFDFRNSPLSIERGREGNKLLIVLQAPGVHEWEVGRPLQPYRIRGGSAGRRCELSWARTGKTRAEFDITNAVQCFPGKEQGARDKEPNGRAIEKCLQWLRADIQSGNYAKVIAFGVIAGNQAACVLRGLQLGVEGLLQVVKHPNGGLRNDVLDSLWRLGAKEV